MENILKKQLEVMMKVESLSRHDRLIQAAQLYESKNIDEDGDRTVDELKKLNTGIENLTEVVSESIIVGQQGDDLARGISTLSKAIDDDLTDNLFNLSKEIREQSRSLAGVARLAEGVGKTPGSESNLSLDSLKGEFLEATNFFGINDKRIAERKFIQEQRALGATGSESELKTSFEGAFQAGTDIKRAEADITRLREATGGKYSDEELMRSSEENAKLFQALNDAIARYATFDRGASLKQEAQQSRAKVGAVEPATTLSPSILAAGDQFQSIMVAKESGLSEAILSVGEQFKAIMEAKGDALLNDSLNVSEEEAEALRMSEEQTEILRRIETSLSGRATTEQLTAPAESRAVPQPSGGGGGGGGGGGSSILGSALDVARFIPGPIGLAASVLSSVIPGRAIGGPIDAGKPYLVGERGPEVVIPRERGQVIPNGQSKTIDLGNGVRKRINPDGSYSISDGCLLYTSDAADE